MGRKSNSKQNSKKPSVPKENNKFLSQKRKDLTVCVDKLLKLTSLILQNNSIISKNCNWDHYMEIESILKQIKDIESKIHNISETKCRKEHIEQFYTWLKENGANFDGIEICEFPGYDLGLKATKEFTEGTLMLTVPKKVMMTENDAHNSELGSFIDIDPLLQNMPNIMLALFLLLEKSNPDSFWKPYIDMLPEKYSTVLYFTSDELLELKPSPVLEQSLKLYRSIARQYAYFYNKIFNMDIPALKNLRDIYSYESYRWAVSTVMTRQNNIHLSELSNISRTAFIPLWDMCNHEHGKVSTDFNSEQERGECFAHRDFKQGEQIFIYYGLRSNSDQFLFNGFVYPDNKQDSMSIVLGMSKGDPLRDTRLEILNKLGLGAVTHYSLYNLSTPISPELLAFIRIFNMDKDELSKWSEKSVPADLVSSVETTSVTEVGPKIDRRAYTYLLTRCNLLLMPYRDVEPVGDLSDHRKNIAALKLCEKKILEHTVAYLKEAISKLTADGDVANE